MDPSEWHSLGRVQYYKHHLYDMNDAWRDGITDLRDYMTASAPFGGPIAFLRDPQRLIKVDTKAGLSRVLYIFNACGSKLAQIPWVEYDTKKKKVINMCWTDEMRLLVVFEDGDCISFSIMGEIENTFTLIPPNAPYKIVSFESWGGGIVCLADNFFLIQVLEIDTVRPRVSLIEKSGLSETNPPTCMAVSDPRFAKTGLPEVYLGTSNNSLIVASKQGFTDMHLQSSIKAPISSIAIAPNGMFMAVFTQDGILSVLNTTLDKKILTFDTQSKTSPLNMLWCGEDSVLLYWQSVGLIMVGPHGSWLKFPYNEPVLLCQEVDCCRIYSSFSHEILMRVPSSTESIKKIASTAPAAMLFDALDAFDSGEAKADENIRAIQTQGTLEQAITDCIYAAGNEFDYASQSALLRAASYGKCFCDNNIKKNQNIINDNSNYDPELFVEMCRKIRVLNALREPSIGLPLTLNQFDRLTSEVVISRLVAMRYHFLALKICEYLKITSDRVLVHWACEKVKSSFVSNDSSAVPLSDESVVALVRKKLKNATLVSYSEIASCAERAGRRRLATMLLDLEENASDQVPLLLSMGEFELALRKAIDSSQSDLIFMALFHMERMIPSEDFRKVLLSEPMYQEAVSLMSSYYIASKTSLNKLDNISTEQQNGYLDLLYMFKLTSGAKNTGSNYDVKLKKLKDAIVKFNNCKMPIAAKLTEEELELAQEQMKLSDKNMNLNLVGLSLSETMKVLCMEAKREPKLLQIAAGLSKKFRVPEKRFYRVKINALAETHQWDALHKFSQEKKNPPCGFKAFAVACLAQGQKEQAESYAARITLADEKFETFIHLEMWTAALEVAIKLKDPEKLSTVRNNCRLPEIQSQVDLAAQQLGFV